MKETFQLMEADKVKPWGGNELDYRGCKIKNNKREKCLYIYDSKGNCLFKVDNYNHGSISSAKESIDILIKRYEQL